MKTDRDGAPQVFQDDDACIDALIAKLGKDLRVGLPLGLGKPVSLINTLYRRAQADPQIKLTLLTALTLEKPLPGSDLEAAFLGPFVQRVFEGVEDLDYARDLSAQRLPANVRVLEFYFRAGSRLGDAAAQRDYICSNYTLAARDIYLQGCNVAMQAIARLGEGPNARYSLSCNPDTSPELVAMLRAAAARGERRVAVIGAVHAQLPFMPHDAEVEASFFDALVDKPGAGGALFSTPKTEVTLPDYAIGLHASALIRDGGTLQIGIGSLGDAIAQALLLRHTDNANYRALLDSLGTTRQHAAVLAQVGGVEPFVQGLYGATEMFVDGFWRLLRGGVLKRRVYDFWALQELINQGACDPDAINADLLDGFVRLGVRVIRGQDFAVLQRHGVFRDGVRYDEGHLIAEDGTRVIANVADAQARRVMAQQCLGERLRGGIVLHGGFFLGPRDFYAGLHAMSAQERALICMTGVNKVNQLDLNPRLYREQRVHARFINTGMMATMSGAVVSDGLADGRVVSGVGGQYNFVAQAQQLATGRSILMVRATRTPEDGGASTSNLVTEYGHCTIPRHLRDLMITEYGIADLRGQTDSEVAKRLLNIADSRFQPELLAAMQRRGKIERGYVIADVHRQNVPEVLQQRQAAARRAGLLPPYPFGSEFTAQELRLLDALRQMKRAAARTPRWRLLLKAWLAPSRVSAPLADDLRRLRLEVPTHLKSRVARALLLDALQAPDEGGR